MDEIRETLREEYPDDLLEEGVRGEAVLWLHVGNDGRVAETRAQASSGHAALDEAAAEVGGSMTFEPAVRDESLTAVWVQQSSGYDAFDQAATLVAQNMDFARAVNQDKLIGSGSTARSGSRSSNGGSRSYPGAGREDRPVLRETRARHESRSVSPRRDVPRHTFSDLL